MTCCYNSFKPRLSVNFKRIRIQATSEIIPNIDDASFIVGQHILPVFFRHFLKSNEAKYKRNKTWNCQHILISDIFDSFVCNGYPLPFAMNFTMIF